MQKYIQDAIKYASVERILDGRSGEGKEFIHFLAYKLKSGFPSISNNNYAL